MGEHLLVGSPLLAEVVLDRLDAFLADLVAVALAALLAHGDVATPKVDFGEVEVADRRPPHAGLDQTVDDRPVAPGPVALAAGTLVGELDVLAAAAISRSPPEHRQVVGGSEELAPLALGERPLDLQARADEDSL